jgi:hypothetical protein
MFERHRQWMVKLNMPTGLRRASSILRAPLLTRRTKIGAVQSELPVNRRRSVAPSENAASAATIDYYSPEQRPGERGLEPLRWVS